MVTQDISIEGAICLMDNGVIDEKGAKEMLMKYSKDELIAALIVRSYEMPEEKEPEEEDSGDDI